MDIGKRIRLARLLAHPSGRLCSVAVDHWFGYQLAGDGAALRDLPGILARLVPQRPSAITMSKGAAMTCWAPHAGAVPLIVQAGYFTADDRVLDMYTDPEECVRLGADAIAVAITVRGPNEGRSLKLLADQVTTAARLGLPVIAHIYPRDYSQGLPRIVFTPEHIEWAVRCGIECGADVIKVGYTGDVESFGAVVRTCPVPIVAAGGPKTASLSDALVAMGDAMLAGARGATIGRNVWGHPDPPAALKAFQSVIWDGAAPSEALRRAALHEKEPQ